MMDSHIELYNLYIINKKYNEADDIKKFQIKSRINHSFQSLDQVRKHL